MTSKPWRIVVTRPEPLAAVWTSKLTAFGYSTCNVCVMEIIPVDDAVGCQRIKNRVLAFDEYQKAIFVSQNAVAEGMRWLDTYWPQLPIGLEYFAIGKATGDALANFSIQVSRTSHKNIDMNSEGLLASDQLQNVQGEKILVFRGCGGRNLLREILESRGAEVDYCELYRRELPAAALAQLTAAFIGEIKNNYRHIIAFHSGESAQNFHQLLLMLASQKDNKLLTTFIRQQPVLVPGVRVATIVGKLGFTHVITAKNASDECMHHALDTFIKENEI